VSGVSNAVPDAGLNTMISPTAPFTASDFSVWSSIGMPDGSSIRVFMTVDGTEHDICMLSTNDMTCTGSAQITVPASSLVSFGLEYSGAEPGGGADLLVGWRSS
jgi:hypothetical protein